MSAFEGKGFRPKRTSLEPQRRQVTTSNCSAYGHSYPTSSDDSTHRRDSAVVPSGHASNVAPIAHLSYYRCLRQPPQEAGGSVPLA